MPKSNFRVDFSYKMCFYFGVIKWLGIFFLSLFVVVGVGVAAEMRLIYWARFSCWLYVLWPIQCHWRVCNHISQYWSYESRSDTAEWVKSFRWKALNMVLIELFATEMYSCVCVSASKGDRDTSKDMVSLSELNDGSSNSNIIRDRCGKCMRPSQVKYCKKIRRTEIWTRKCISWSACKMHEWKVSQRKKREGERIKSLIEKLNYFLKSVSSSAYMFTHTHKESWVGTLLEI